MMARSQRRDADTVRLQCPPPSTPGVADDWTSYQPGGQVGAIQADLARRLGLEGIADEAAIAFPSMPFDDRPGEQMVQFVSVAGGVLALLVVYAGMIFLMVR